MEYFWHIFLSAFLLLIVWGIVSIKRKNNRIQKEVDQILPRIADHIQVGRRYNIYLSDGEPLNDVCFLGISSIGQPYDSGLPYQLREWLIVEKPNGKRGYLKPESIRYCEDAGVE